jgi:hypothetical protein
MPPTLDRADELHAQIMNLPCNLALCPTEATTVMAYTRGYRDARHAAAELVAPLLGEQQEAETANSVYSAQRSGEAVLSAPSDYWRHRALLAEDAYLNMRQWAEQNGLDTATYSQAGWIDVRQQQPEPGQRIEGMSRSNCWTELWEPAEPLGHMTHWRPAPPVGADNGVVSKIIPESGAQE